jgi:2-polyprenyl-3-methyl-5-hydroxy-6-metoxy-1,4-benzoquinol methylase
MPIPYTPLEWTPDRIKKFWAYQGQFPETFFSHQVGPALVRKVAPYLKNKRAILDYGCGSGTLIAELLRQGFDVTGADFSPASLKTINQKFKDTKDFRGAFTVEDLMARAKKFDAVFVVEVIEHLENKPLQDLFGNLQQLLSPDGVIVLTTPCDENLTESYVFCPQCEHYFHRMQHVRSWTPATLSEFLGQQGFQPVALAATDLSLLYTYGWPRLKSLIKQCLGHRANQPHLVAVAKRS